MGRHRLQRHRDSPRWPLRLVWAGGGLMALSGLTLLGLIALQVLTAPAVVAQQQQHLNQALTQQWATGASEVGSHPTLPAVPGDAIGRLYIPRLDMHWVVVEGVEEEAIRGAPGHYPGTAAPGQVGNFSVAGHREVGMWADLDKVKNGDAIVVETAKRWYVYTVSTVRIVDPSAVEEVAPQPPGYGKGQKLLTLTTCNPRFDNYERLIVHATLARTTPRADGPPAELAS